MILLALLLAQLAGTPGQIQTPNAGRWTSQQGTVQCNGTGCVTRTIASKEADFYNVLDFGAKCDGVTDDTAAIQQAEDTTVTKGVTLYFPPSNCYIAGTITIRGGTNWEGIPYITRLQNGSNNTTILKVLNAGVGRTDEIRIRGFLIYSNQAASATVLDLRGASYLSLEDVKVYGNINGAAYADASTSILIDLTAGGSWSGFNVLKNVYASFGGIGLQATSQPLTIIGGSYNWNRTRGIYLTGCNGVGIYEADISSNARGQVATFSVDRYSVGGLLVETSVGVVIAGGFHEFNALRESASQYSPNDVEILTTNKWVTYHPGRADVSGVGPIYGRAQSLGVQYTSARGPQYGNELGVVPNGEFRFLTGTLPLGWLTAGTIAGSAASTLPTGVTGRRFTATTDFSRIYYQIFSAADCVRLAGKTLTVSFWANPVTSPWTSGFLRGGITTAAGGDTGGSSYFVLTAGALNVAQLYSAKYTIVGNEANGLAVTFEIGTFATAAVFEVGNVSGNLSEFEPYIPEQAVTSAGGPIWNPTGFTIGTLGFTNSASTTTGITIGTVTQANLGTPANGTLYYCSDCTTASACTAAGTGALASRQNGAWKCL